jgi:uncharacterized protein (TIGR02569 family)
LVARRSPPSPVLRAFGVDGPSVPLAGGQESSWRADDVVLKPADLGDAELEWQAALFGPASCDGFRVARPLQARDGSFVVGGWCAWQAVSGRHEERRWPEIIAIGERFHAALVGVPRPDFLSRRTDPWAVGDRVAWGDLPADEFVHVKHLARLVSALRPVGEPSQLIHGDLTGNVLFDDQLPPAIIDLSPYWRPTHFASAIVVADALVWEAADESILGAVAHVEDFAQYLLRALIYRAVTDRLTRSQESIRPEDADPYLPVVELACRLAANT